MNALPSSKVPFLRRARLGFCALLGLLILPIAQADTLTVRNKTKGPVKTLVSTFPQPTGNTPGPSTLLVFPLLGGNSELLPGGKLLVWVGRSDGTPHASAAVTVRVPDIVGKNTLVSTGGQRVHEVFLQTDANGLAQVNLAAPEVPPPNDGSNGGGDGNNGGGGGGE